MSPLSRRHFASLAVALATALPANAARADPPPAAPDTSSWKCEQCPFYQGYDAQAQAETFYPHGANASYGRYTGIDRSTAYADASASGQYRRDDGTYANYDLERLGLPSPSGYVQGGREGRFDFQLSYEGQPTRLYDTGVTPYLGLGQGVFGLPANWAHAGSTAGMTQLGADAAPLSLEYNRRTLALLGRLFASENWTVFGEFRRQEKEGTDFTSASFLTQAVQLPEPIDYVTNSFEGGVAWAGRGAALRVSYTGSWFEDNSDSLTFANPYLSFVPGSTQGRLALPPSNDLQQLTASGNVQLPWFATVLTYGASLGRELQNAAFLPISTLPGSAVPMPASLDGDVHLSHYALGLAARPLPKLSVRGNAVYDGRDDATEPLTIAYIVTDTFPGALATTPRYGEDRVRLDGSADYALFPWVRLGVGGELQEVHYSPGQVLTHAQDADSWGRASIAPLASLTFTLKGGNDYRKTSPFDADALPSLENPLLREFDYATRDRVFYSITGTWSATQTLTWALEGYFANDDYPLSPLGLQSSHERRASTTLTWKARENLSVYADGGYERLYLLQSGYTGPATAPWQVADTEGFWDAGAGAQWLMSTRWVLKLDYMHAPSYTDTDTSVGGVAQFFPQNSTQLDSLRLDVAYKRSAALQFHFRYNYERYNSNDWALDGVGPQTVPNLLALGLQPYRYNVSAFALTASYQFGTKGATATNSQ